MFRVLAQVLGRFVCPVVFAAFACWTPAALGGEPERIHMAGSFNGWATSDGAYELKKAGGQYELVRFFPAGTAEFKFVFDGSWTRHLGDGGDGRLTQPGGNIHLAIRQAGYYVVSLDLTTRTWGLRKMPPPKPRALLRLRPVTHREVVLDASGSFFRPGHPIQAFRFTVDGPGSRGEAWELRQADSEQARLLLSKPGRFEITLRVDDGELQDETTVAATLGNGYDLQVGERPSGATRLMYAVGEGFWGGVYEAPADGEETFTVLGLDLGPEGRRATRSVKMGRRYLVRYDATSQSLSLVSEGWRAFDFDATRMSGLPPKMRIERVDLVGDFNGWRAGANAMRPIGDDRFQTLIALADGVYHYKFLVNGSIYLQDPAADPQFSEDDGQGGRNSGFRIGDDASLLGPAKPGEIALAAFKHDPTQDAYFTPVARHVARLTVRTLADDVEQVGVKLGGAGEPVRLTRLRTQYGFDFWSGVVQTAGSSFDYTVTLRDGDSAHTAHYRPRVRIAGEVPDWAKRAVWYQIFPERFRDGDPSNNPPRTVPWSQSWYKPYVPGPGVKKGSPEDFTERGTFYQFIFDRRYGGDVQGIREKLPYLRSLGVTAIYLNPVFLAESMHKYDTADYRHIDDYFGVRDSLRKIDGETEDPATWQWSESDRVFLDFLKEAHRQGFKVIIDGVFNHVGRGFWAFRDVLEHGERSPYAGWFDITSFKPFHYKAWDRDDGSLPRLKHDEALGLCEPVRKHLFAITRRWMDPDGDGDPSDGIDGWRLDVASDINANFWRDWREVVKSINPEAYIVAELWTQSGEWLDGRTFDAVMNYPFARRCQRFFVNRRKASKPSVFRRELEEMLGWYRAPVTYALQNLFDSHDTDRVASMFMNPDLPYDRANRIQDNGPKYNPAKPTPDCYVRLRAMVTFQMTFLGAPMVYYGDEAGMYGADDPSNRKPMLWPDLPPNDDPDERIEPDVSAHYRRLIAIRNTLPALQFGSFEVLLAHDRNRLFAFSRTLNGRSVVVVVNNSDKRHRLDVPVPWADGARIVRLDDPEVCEIVEGPAGDPAARPRILLKPGRKSKLKVAAGRLKGPLLAPRSAGVYVEVALVDAR